jgi:hypothetical protein
MPPGDARVLIGDEDQGFARELVSRLKAAGFRAEACAPGPRLARAGA